MMPMRNTERTYGSDSEDFESGSDSASEAVLVQRRTVRAAGALGLFAVGCLVVAFSSGSAEPARASVSARVSLAADDSTQAASSASLSMGTDKSSETVPVAAAATPVLAATAAKSATPVYAAMDAKSQVPAAPDPRAAKTGPEKMGTNVDPSLVPKEDTSDGNVCNDDEEFNSGSCFMKCATLTKLAYTVRQTPFHCCKKAVCDLSTIFDCCKHDFGFCSGFDIAGAQEGDEACPHKPGACLTNEELFGGMCYKKCALLSNGLYKTRVAAGTCCETTGPTCLFAEGASDGLNGQSNSSIAYAVGGGCGDGSDFTHCAPHPPQQALTAEIHS